jgi:uncharacterized membrane protein
VPCGPGEVSRPSPADATGLTCEGTAADRRPDSSMAVAPACAQAGGWPHRTVPRGRPDAPHATRRSPHVRPRAQPLRSDRFGQAAERFARVFGTPKFILGQTLLVVVWIALNAMAVSLRWDPYPFIVLNLAVPTQAAYAAPLILLAQTRQADPDKAAADNIARIADEQRRHVEQQSNGLRDLVQANTALTERIAAVTSDIHAVACGQLRSQLSDDDVRRHHTLPRPTHKRVRAAPAAAGWPARARDRGEPQAVRT